MTTPRILMPELVSNQAQPHITHNQALRILDGLLGLHIVGDSSNVAPASPEPAVGAGYFIPVQSPLATGAWAGEDGNIAIYQGSGAWIFVVPYEGLMAWFTGVSPKGLFVYTAGAFARQT